MSSEQQLPFDAREPSIPIVPCFNMSDEDADANVWSPSQAYRRQVEHEGLSLNKGAVNNDIVPGNVHSSKPLSFVSKTFPSEAEIGLTDREDDEEEREEDRPSAASPVEKKDSLKENPIASDKTPDTFKTSGTKSSLMETLEQALADGMDFLTEETDAKDDSKEEEPSEMGVDEQTAESKDSTPKSVHTSKKNGIHRVRKNKSKLAQCASLLNILKAVSSYRSIYNRMFCDEAVPMINSLLELCTEDKQSTEDKEESMEVPPLSSESNTGWFSSNSRPSAHKIVFADKTHNNTYSIRFDATISGKF